MAGNGLIGNREVKTMMGEYLVWCPGNAESPEDGRRFFAESAIDAAESWAEKDDRESTAYGIASGEKVTVMVRSFGGTERRFEVTGESIPTYTSLQVGGLA